MDNPIKIVERPRYADLGYGKGEVEEFSKVVEARNASREESKPLQKSLIQSEGTSLHESDKECKASRMIGEHPEGVKIVSSQQTCSKIHHERYNRPDYSNIFFDYKKNGKEKHSLWYKCPCMFSGLHNHCVAKCWKRKSLYKKFMSTRKEERRKDHSPRLNVEHGNKELKSKNYCNHCNMSAHWIDICWKFHPQLHLKQGKKVVHALMKKEVVDERVVQTPTIQEKQPKKENSLVKFGKKWVTYLQSCLLLLL
jgi:hypothetical protein